MNKFKKVFIIVLTFIMFREFYVIVGCNQEIDKLVNYFKMKKRIRETLFMNII